MTAMGNVRGADERGPGPQEGTWDVEPSLEATRSFRVTHEAGKSLQGSWGMT